MSKQSESKERQNYVEKPVPIVCSNCRHYRSEFEEYSVGYKQEKNIRCGLGGFRVNKTAFCDMFEAKQ